ncbi:hypothetical protein FHT86_000984 [Rhizobium sp. BK313]|uniref:hypothetical protein n=1 Tax=Rhizobium sp. BK313 TaxID=2587081 RepID=UPI001061C897|nr:hypothetical protein [Rhizobium sp. BK313]MBB3452728.1 hypothetical protein [Rhizobium sp. BK313]
MRISSAGTLPQRHLNLALLGTISQKFHETDTLSLIIHYRGCLADCPYAAIAHLHPPSFAAALSLGPGVGQFRLDERGASSFRRKVRLQALAESILSCDQPRRASAPLLQPVIVPSTSSNDDPGINGAVEHLLEAFGGESGGSAHSMAWSLR